MNCSSIESRSIVMRQARAHWPPAGRHLCGGLLVLLTLGCGAEKLYTPEGPNSIRIDLAEGTLTGCEQNPDGSLALLPFSIGTRKVTATFTVLDAQGDRDLNYNGALRLSLLPGKIAPAVIFGVDSERPGANLLEQGQVTQDIQITGFGHGVRIWAEALDDDGRHVAGVSEPFCYVNPTISQLQANAKGTANNPGPLRDRDVVLDRGTMIIAAITKSGFFATDVGSCRIKPKAQWQAEVEASTTLPRPSRLDCSRSFTRAVVTLTDEELVTLEIPERDTKAEVWIRPAGDEDAAPYVKGQDYSAQEDETTFALKRKQGGAIPSGAQVVVEWSSKDDPLVNSSIYAYTFNMPYGVELGARLCLLSGGVSQFLGLTEISFPTFRIYLEGGPAAAEQIRPINEEAVPDPRDDPSYLYAECELENPTWQGPEYVPDPVPIFAEEIPGAEVRSSDASQARLDSLESSLVRLTDVSLPSLWKNCDLDGSGSVDRCWDSDRAEGRCLPNQVLENDCEMACSTHGKVLQSGLKAKDFVGCTEQANFDNYGQFVVQVRDSNGKTSLINLNTRSTVPEFEPRPKNAEMPYARIYPGTERERKVKAIRSVVGVLLQINSARPIWQVVPRSLNDFEFEFVNE